MKIGWLLFENYHQRKNIGSSRIRGHWIIEQIKEAELFKQGEAYDVVVFQKTYFKEFIREFNGLKVLDICDPDWLDGLEIVNILKYIDLVIVPTEKLKESISKFTEKNIVVIPDGVKFDGLPKPKEHQGKAKKVCWFGYSQNIAVLDQTLMKLRKLGLKLKVISDGNYQSGEMRIENVKWDINTVNEEIQECDFCLLPEWIKGRNAYKSNNKTLQAWALGMPVASTPQDLERFMDAEERNKEAKEKYEFVKENYDVNIISKKYKEEIQKAYEEKRVAK